MKRTTLSIAAICGILFALAVPTFASVVETGLLYQGQSDEYSIKLYAGTTYEIAAISDTYDCDLDLYVYDSDGDIVAVDNTNSSDAYVTCLLYPSDAADDLLCVDIGGRRLH